MLVKVATAHRRKQIWNGDMPRLWERIYPQHAIADDGDDTEVSREESRGDTDQVRQNRDYVYGNVAIQST